MARTQVIIPFRDRGLDPRRAANLAAVRQWWEAQGYTPAVVDDGLANPAQFNRNRAYNRAVAAFPETEVFVFTEADMLIHREQIEQAVRLAESKPGLVVPFTQYRYLSEQTSAFVRGTFDSIGGDEFLEWTRLPAKDPYSVFDMRPESTMDDGKSIGAVNVVSRETLSATGGFTEATSGNWYDDNIIEEGFAYLTGTKTRFVQGPAIHLYHLPGWKGDHLTAADKRATANNKRILTTMRRDIRNRNAYAVRRLMGIRGAR